MIFHWPRAIGTPGRISGQVGHLSDIFPTVLDILDMEYPAEYAGRQLYPLRGQSLLPQIRSGSETPRTVCWNYEKFSAVRMGNWKAVRQSKSSSQPDGTWQLYDLSKDRSETSDLAESNPERVESLAGQWNAWHQDIGPLHKERPVGKEERKKSRSKK
jgi:arylsulfatase